LWPLNQVDRYYLGSDETAGELRPCDGGTAYKWRVYALQRLFFELNPIEKIAIRLKRNAASIHLPKINGKACAYNTHRALSCQQSLQAASRNKALSIIPPC
jgi:hypothetical protein